MPTGTVRLIDAATAKTATRSAGYRVLRVGAAVGKVSGSDPAVSAFVTKTGALDVRRYYCATTLPPVSTFTADVTAGRGVSIDFKPSSAVTVQTWASWLLSLKAAGVMARISLWHEPTDDMTAAAYIALITPYVPAIRAAGFRHQWCVTNYSFVHEGASAYYPGDGYVDDVCPDYYAQGSAPAPGGTGDTLAAIEAFADAHGKPLGLLEFSGSPVSGSTVETIGDAFLAYVTSVFTARLAAGKPVADLLYFNSGSNTLSNQPPSFLAAYQALRTAVS